MTHLSTSFSFSNTPQSLPRHLIPPSRNPYPIIFLPHKPIIQQRPLRFWPGRHLEIKLEHQHWDELVDLQKGYIFA